MKLSKETKRNVLFANIEKYSGNNIHKSKIEFLKKELDSYLKEIAIELDSNLQAEEGRKFKKSEGWLYNEKCCKLFGICVNVIEPPELAKEFFIDAFWQYNLGDIYDDYVVSSVKKLDFIDIIKLL